MLHKKREKKSKGVKIEAIRREPYK
jgi:hypothetical protein